MEARRDSLATIKLCRFCLSQGDTLTSIYEKRSTKNTVNLPLKILSCVSFEVFPSDKKPTYICNRCKFFMEMSYDFKHICRQADEQILQFIQNATPLAPMSWPQSLVKLFRLAHKSPEVPLMKTVIEGGATVHVTAQETDTDEEDDENVYNVKIGDGSDDGSKSARIKVINAVEKQDKGKAKRAKGFPSLPKVARPVRIQERPQPEERSFPCKYCNKIFIKSHHYKRHLRLKHHEANRTCRGPFGESDQYRCEQCEDSFATQDELIYHSAIHATQNLTCPLCQEKFEDVDAVTAHIKSHVNGTEFMCDLCELVFTSKEKLDLHITIAHDDEIRSVPNLDESSTEMDVDEDEEDSAINVKELDDHMVIELKKTSDYLISKTEEDIEKPDLTQSEESDSDMLPDLGSSITNISNKNTGKEPAEISIATVGGATITKTVPAAKKEEKSDNQTASILRKAEEVKKKVIPQLASEPIAEKKILNKAENNSAGTSDKSLRMLEKDLQELKRTNPRNEVAKTPAKPLETLRSRRAQIHTSTPKPRTPTDDRKMQITAKSPVTVPEKKVPERRILTKENKEPKENKDTKSTNGNGKEEREIKEKQVKEKDNKEKELKEKELKDKELKEKELKEKELKEKEVKQKEVKEKETPKNAAKNGSDKCSSEEGIRRSTRPSKIKDYAKMIRDRSQDSDEENDDTDDGDDEEYKEEVEKTIEPKVRARKPIVKTPAPKATPPPATPTPRKRGRPRKDAVVAKVRKEEIEEDDEGSESEKEKPKASAAKEEQDIKESSESAKSENSEQKAPHSTLVSPTGQTLKKIPCNALPPGVKATPLPAMSGVCEMQIGKKLLKVQKIVMTKAEVEAMAKKGLLQMRDGNVILKPGVRLPTDPAMRSTENDESPAPPPPPPAPAAPSRCDLGDDS